MDLLISIFSAAALLAAVIFIAWLYVRILHKASFSGWWTILMFIPVVNIIMIWIFAFVDWPSLRKNTALKPMIQTPPHQH